MNVSRQTLTTFVLVCGIIAGFTEHVWAQTKVGYVATDVIRERFPDAQAAEQRILTITNEWKKDIENQQNEIRMLEEEVKKKRLIWSEEERRQKESILEKKRLESEDYSKQKFGPSGEFDKLVRDTYKPIEEKIAAAIQDVARADNYDVVWDKSTQPLIYVNPRYDVTIKVMERLEIPVDDLREQYEKLLENAPEEKREKPKRRRRVRRVPTDRQKDDQKQEEQQQQQQEAPALEEKK